MSVERSPWRAPIALAYAAFVLVGLSAGVAGVLLPAQIRDYGVDKTTIGITFFTFAAGFMLAGSTAGALAHRLSPRIALALGGGGFTVAGLYLATRPPFAALVAVQLLEGYGIGLLEAVLNVYLVELPSATTLLNRLHAFFGVGALLGPLLAAWVLGFAPWTAVWLVLGLAGVPLVGGFLVGYPRPAGHASGPKPATAAAANGRHVQDQPRSGLLTAAVRAPAVVLAATFLAVYVGLEISVGNWGFTYLVDQHGQRTLLAGYTVSGYWLGLTLGRFLISPIATRIGLTPGAMTMWCLAGVTAAAVLTWAAPTAAIAAVGFVLLGFFLGPVFPTAMAVVPSLTTTRLVPTAIGLMNGVSVVGGAVFPWLAGTIAQTVGVWTLLPFAVALALVQLGIWRLLIGRMTTA